MSQMHVRSCGGDHIGGPIPAVGGLEDHLGASLARAITSAMATGSLTICTVSIRSPPESLRTITLRRQVQVDADILWLLQFHGDLLSS